jgi:hypothetical protein
MVRPMAIISSLEIESCINEHNDNAQGLIQEPDMGALSQ